MAEAGSHVARSARGERLAREACPNRCTVSPSPTADWERGTAEGRREALGPSGAAAR